MSVLIDQNSRDSTKDKLRRKIFFFSDKVFFWQEMQTKKKISSTKDTKHATNGLH